MNVFQKLILGAMLDNIGEQISKAISQFLFWICEGVLWVLYYLEQAFYYLAGTPQQTTAIDSGIGDGENIVVNLMKNTRVQNAFTIFLIAAIMVFVICTIIALFKANWHKDEPGAMKKALKSCGSTLLTLIFLPICVFFFIKISTEVMSVLVQNVSNVLTRVPGDTSSNATMANTLFRSLFDVDSITLSYISAPQYSVQKLPTYDSLVAIGIEMNVFKGANFNYLLAIIVGCIVIWSMLMATIGLVERLINIILLYIIAPFPAATVPIDDGERFKNWRDLLLAKVLGVIGNILSIYIYLYIINQLHDLASGGWLEKFIYYLIVIGGGFTAAKGSNLIASIISHAAGVQDGMSQGQSQALLASGARLAGATLGLAARGAKGIVDGGVSGTVSGARSTAAKNAASAISNNGRTTGNGSLSLKEKAGAFMGNAAKSTAAGAVQMSQHGGGMMGGLGFAAGAALGGAVHGVGKLLGKGASAIGNKLGQTAIGRGARNIGNKIEAKYNAHKISSDAKKDAVRAIQDQRAGLNMQHQMLKKDAVTEQKEALSMGKEIMNGKLDIQAFKDKFGSTVTDSIGSKKEDFTKDKIKAALENTGGTSTNMLKNSPFVRVSKASSKNEQQIGNAAKSELAKNIGRGALQVRLDEDKGGDNK